MAPDIKGRLCGQCHKVVIDFSRYTDKELVEFFTKAKEKVCGNFHSTQLQRLIVATEPSNTSLFHKVLLGTALIAGVAGTVQGQSNIPVNTTITPTPADTTKKVTENKAQLPHTSQNHTCNIPENNIRGTVMARTEYIVDGVKKTTRDTIHQQSSTDFIKELTKSHLETPASNEGAPPPNK